MTIHLQNVLDARARIAPFIKKTPLIRAYALEKRLQTQSRVFLKCEHLQLTNSFKLRGAFNALLQLSPLQRQKGAITRSSGNFAQALSYAAKVLNIPVYIIMPENVPLVKKERTESYGAHVIIYGKGHKEQQEKAVELAKEKELAVLSPYDHLDVIAGQGTISLEIYEELPSISHYFCPVGGGGLMGGTALALKELNTSVQVIGIEPLGANDYYLSRESGTRMQNKDIATIADGLRAPQVGACNWPLLQANVDEVCCVGEDQIKQALKLLYKEMGLLVEPSGAVSIAGLLKYPLLAQADIVCVLSGGNVDLDCFYKWIEEV